MGRRSERLSKQGMLASDLAGDGDVIQVVSRAFDVLRCFEGHEARLGNLEISNRCGLPRSTVSRLTHTLTRMGQLVYLPRDQKYRIGPSAVAMSTSSNVKPREAAFIERPVLNTGNINASATGKLKSSYPSLVDQQKSKEPGT